MLIVLGVFTPIILVLSMGLGLVVLGLLTFGFGALVCPYIGYRVSRELCEYAYGLGGQLAFKRYAVSTIVGFVLWAGILVGPALLSGAMFEEGFGLFLPGVLIPIGLGSGFLLWALAAGRWMSLGVDRK